MIYKDLEDVSYADIQSLLENKIAESDVLDYKEEMICDEKLVRHVCALANSRGGDIIFGVRELGKGGHPVEIPGLEESLLNKERIE